MEEPIFRRFTVIGDEEKVQAALTLIEKKGLSHEDIELLLETLKLS